MFASSKKRLVKYAGMVVKVMSQTGNLLDSRILQGWELANQITDKQVLSL